MASDPSFSSYKLLSFDCFGTIVDWESGIWNALQPLVTQVSSSSKLRGNRDATIKRVHEVETKLLAANPTAPYDELLATLYNKLAEEEGVKLAAGEAEKFSHSISDWKAFPDSFDALHRLQKHYKLVILSNVDNASFSRVLSGPLAGVKFDAVYTAQDIGSYKPDLNNFHYLIDNVKGQLGVERAGILHVAHGLPSDHVPAKQMGLPSIWIARGDTVSDASKQYGDRIGFLGSFDTLGEMADAVERQF